MNALQFYVFESHDSPARARDGGSVALVFSTPAKAHEFAAAKGYLCPVRELELLDAVEWLRAGRAKGVSAVWKDPDPHQDAPEEIPVDDVIALMSAVGAAVQQ
jgi:hypothetical protein